MGHMGPFSQHWICVCVCVWGLLRLFLVTQLYYSSFIERSCSYFSQVLVTSDLDFDVKRLQRKKVPNSWNILEYFASSFRFLMISTTLFSINLNYWTLIVFLISRTLHHLDHHSASEASKTITWREWRWKHIFSTLISFSNCCFMTWWLYLRTSKTLWLILFIPDES